MAAAPKWPHGHAPFAAAPPNVTLAVGHFVERNPPVLFAITCLDKPESASVRQANRPAHLEYAKATAGLKMGGPLLSDDGERMIGSMLVLEAADRAEAEAWCANDPYAKAGLFESVTIRPFKWLLPQAVG